MCIMFVSTIIMCGHTEAAARRYQVDTRQIETLTALTDTTRLFTNGSNFCPYSPR